MRAKTPAISGALCVIATQDHGRVLKNIASLGTAVCVPLATLFQSSDKTLPQCVIKLSARAKRSGQSP
jgi:hypothetical protein